MSYIEVKNLSKIYGTGELEVKALDDVSFDIDQGEFVIILGASGAGKSTLLNILGGMDNSTKGITLLRIRTQLNTMRKNQGTLEEMISALSFSSTIF